MMFTKLRKLLGPKPMPLGLQPKTGEIYGHVFENPRMGFARRLFWNLNVEFEPIQRDGEEWDCSLGIEWLTLPVRTWRDLDGMDLGQVVLPEMLECSLYLYDTHNPAVLRQLQLSEVRPAEFEARFSAIAEVYDEIGTRSVEISGKCEVSFSGIIVVADNLTPKPSAPNDAAMAVADFLALDDLDVPLSEQWRFVLRPLT